MQGSPDIAQTGAFPFHPDGQPGGGGTVPSLFAQLADLQPAERDARLARLEQSDPAGAAELRSLLEAADRAGDFLAILGDDAGRRTSAGPVLPHAAGQRIGPYQLERALGHGGAGVVWLASDSRLDRKIALKLYPAPAAAAGPDCAQGLMLREARAAARLDHPNVAAVHDVGRTDDGMAYMAMTWCEGGSLADRLRVGALPVDDALAMAVDLASALAAAHGQGVLHRDVKPGNVLFDADGRARLGDFGIALRSSGAPGGDCSGTLPYMAPEILRGAPADARSDLWSLGVTLFEALSGVAPFRGGSGTSTVQQILAAEPLAGVAADAIPPPIRPTLGRLLRKNPSERHQSAAEVRRELVQVQARLRERRVRHAPPAPLSPLVGRVELMATAHRLLEQARLVTLVGPGGTGKTRLALELARHREPVHAAGACFVPLAAVPSADQLFGAVAEALGLRQRGSAEASELVRQYCEHADLLLVLDNCEHLPDAAEVISVMLAHAPEVRILATSRGPLGIDGEQALAVPPLALPESGAGAAMPQRETEAVQLFCQRAAARNPAFKASDADLPLIIDICRRLDGLPLAIELAAARVHMFGLRELLSRLEQSTDWLQALRRDRPERHRTLSNAIKWSYELLGEEEQRLFRFVAVCEDPFRADAAAALVKSAHVPDAWALLDSLAEKALVVAQPMADGATGFGMLSTIRDFARARLDQAGETSTARRHHAEWVSAVAVEAGPELIGPGQVDCLARLGEMQHDIRAALAWLIDNGPLESAARMAVDLHRYWLVRSGSLRDIVGQLTRLEERLRNAGTVPDPVLHARFLSVLGSLTGTIGTHQTVPHRHFEASLALFRAAHDAAGMARALNHIGWSAHLLGRLEQAEQASAEALEIHRQRQDDGGVATSCINLGWIALLRGEFSEAERCFSHARTIHQRTGDRRSLAYATGHLASLALAQGNASRALELREETGRLLEQVGDQLAWPAFEVRFMQCAHEALRPASAARLEDELLPRLRAAGHGWAVGYALNVLAALRLHEGDASGAEKAAEESLQIRRAAGVRSGEAESEWMLGRIALMCGRRAASARHLSRALSERVAMGERAATIETLEAVAHWFLDADAEMAITLLDGCTAARTRLGAGRTPRWDQVVEHVRRLAVSRGNAVSANRERQRGAEPALDELVRLARAQLARRAEAAV